MNEMNQNDDQTRAFVIPTVGARIAHYTITDRLGSGGMGDVFLADDTRLRRSVALKFLSSRFTADDTFRARFIREAQSAAALNHPNIVTIYEVGEADGQVYIAMEHIAGRSLREVIDEGALDLNARLDIALQVCMGLASAHAAGVVHRDIKPENVLLDDDGRVRILDFGLAKADGDEQLTQAGTALGTANYMSPEQGRGEEADHRSDIFSLGVLLYELLSGQLPFRRANMPATIYAVIHEPAPPLATHMPDAPEGIQAILDRALAKDHADRYTSIKQTAEDIGQIIGLQYRPELFRSAVTPAAPAVTKVQSLAVLHLRNLGSPDDEFLSYGITEDLIVDLTRVGTVRVAPMRSILKYKDSDAELEEIARKLKVSYVFDGSIHKSEKTIRVSASLIDVQSGENLWADRWEQPLDNLPQVKKALADGVVKAFDIGRTVVAAAEVGEPEAENRRAYENYLRGKFTFDHKQDVGDIDIALGLYRQAIKDEPSLIAARTGIAEILMHQGEVTRAEEELRLALAESERQGSRPDQAAILLLLARLLVRRSDWDQALEAADRAMAATTELNDLEGQVQALGVQISIAQPQGDFNGALQLFDRVLELSRRLDDQDKIAEALKNMGVVYSRKGDPERALQLYEESLALARQQENLTLQAACLSNIGNLHFFGGDIDAAFDRYREAREMHTRLGDTAMAARPTLNMGLTELRRGNHEQGLLLLNQAADIFRDTGDRATYAMTLVNISQIRLTRGETDQAMAVGEEALKIAREIKHVHAESTALLRIAAAAAESDDPKRAEEVYLLALEVADQGRLARNVCLAHMGLVDLYRSTGDDEQFRRHLTEGLVKAKEIGERAAIILLSAHQAAVTVGEGLYFAGLNQLRDRAKEARELGDDQIRVAVETILGETLLTQGRSAEDRDEGAAILLAAQAFAREAGMISEAGRIETILAVRS